MTYHTTKLSYDSLWHLVSLGILTPEHQPNGWYPDQVKTASRVAMIDTSVAMDHPNLREAINTSLAFDLFSTRLGAFPGRCNQKSVGAINLGDAAALVAGLPGCEALLSELLARLAPDQPPTIGTIQPATSPVFSGHGTAIAGLIGARPTIVPVSEAHIDGPEDSMLALPYCGVDPTCEIVPISTNFDTDPDQIILAFLYADLIGADVIVLPRGIPDPFRNEPELFSQEFVGRTLGELTAPCPITDDHRQLWAELAELIVKISHRRPIVCAGGNDHEEYGIYPANLASVDNGVIAVGAVNAKGYPCSYSPSYGLTVWAPSTDAEAFNSAEVRLDMTQPRLDELGIPDINRNDAYSGYEIISTDVPGRGGYSASPYVGPEPDDGLREYGSYFCRFGGTSASCAIIAGFLSLARGLGKLPGSADGIEAKSWLMAQSNALNADYPNMLVPTLWGDAFEPADRSTST